MKRYYAVRPISIPAHIRIEKAESPTEATRLAFGRPTTPGHWEWKDMGTRVSVIQSDSKRLALLNDPTGWHALGGGVNDVDLIKIPRKGPKRVSKNKSIT